MGPAGMVLGVFAFILLVLLVMWVVPGWPRRVARVLTLVGLCGTLLVVLLLGELALVIDRTALSATFHTGAFEKANLPSLLPGAVADALIGQAAGQAANDAKQRELSRLVHEGLAYALPADWTKSQVEALVNQVFAYLRARTDTLGLSLDLREPKQRALQFLAAARAEPRLVAGFKEFVRKVPDELTGTSTPQLAQLEHTLGQVRPVVRAVSLAVPAAGVLAVLLALMVWLACGRSRVSASWVGCVFLLAGVTVAGIGVVAEPWLLQRCAAVQMPPAFAGLPARAWLETMASGVLAFQRLVGVATLATGVVLLVLWALKLRRPTVAPLARGEPPVPQQPA
ncbi:MAG: hypothetical protein QME70_01690 [Bacillota bacterium]|nr:hypothetical protein [Bacillota bacterium]